MAITVADTAPVQAVTLGRMEITVLLIVTAARPFLSSISNQSNLTTSRATTKARGSVIFGPSPV
jgi:hypothetical protein